MTKRQNFIKSIRDLSLTMTADQIERAIRALQDSRREVFSAEADKKHREYMKKVLPKGDSNVEKYLKIVRKNKRVFSFRKLRKTGRILASGAGLLSREDYEKYQKWLPSVNRDWWLLERVMVKFIGGSPDKRGKTKPFLREDPNGGCVGGVRPVLLIDKIEGDLLPGDSFTIGEDAFMLLNRRLAIRSALLPSLNCGYQYYTNYSGTSVQQSVDWWYRFLG